MLYYFICTTVAVSWKRSACEIYSEKETEMLISTLKCKSGHLKQKDKEK